MKSIQERIANDNVVKVLFLLGWPMMITSFLQSAYNLADTFWVGQLGPERGANAIAALQITWPVVWLLISLGMGFGVAGLALVSQYVGAKEYDKVNKSGGQVFFLFAAFSVVVGLLGFILTPFLVKTVVPDGDVQSMAVIYMRVIFLGMPFMFSAVSFDFLLRGYGDTRTPMYITAGTVAINIVLDPILMFGPSSVPYLGFLSVLQPLFGSFHGFGFVGAAYATFITRLIASLISITLLFSGRVGVKLSLKDVMPDWKKIWKIIRVGFPASLGSSGAALGFVIMMFMVARVDNGTVALAAYGIGDRIISIMFIVISGLAMALSTMVGQNLGAGNVKRAEKAAKSAMVLMGSLLGVGALGIWLLREPLLGIFTTNTEVLQEGMLFIGIFGLFMPSFGIFQAVHGVYSGSGRTTYSMTLMIIRLWALRVPLAFLFAFVLNMGSVGIWWAMGISNLVAGITAVGFFYWGKWKKTIIEDEKVEKVPVSA